MKGCCHAGGWIVALPEPSCRLNPSGQPTQSRVVCAPSRWEATRRVRTGPSANGSTVEIAAIRCSGLARTPCLRKLRDPRTSESMRGHQNSSLCDLNKSHSHQPHEPMLPAAPAAGYDSELPRYLPGSVSSHMLPYCRSIPCKPDPVHCSTCRCGAGEPREHMQGGAHMQSRCPRNWQLRS